MNEQSCQRASNLKAEPDFAAFIAIDWADKKHFWSMRVAGAQKVERGELENTPEAVEVWIAGPSGDTSKAANEGHLKTGQ